MMLTKATVAQIWNSLKGYRLAYNSLGSTEPSVQSLNRETVTLPDSQDSTCSTSTLSPPNSQESVVTLGRSASAGS